MDPGCARKWEGPQLRKTAMAFWAKCKARDHDRYGQLREMKVEDKSSLVIDLVQTLVASSHPEGAEHPDQGY